MARVAPTTRLCTLNRVLRIRQSIRIHACKYRRIRAAHTYARAHPVWPSTPTGISGLEMTRRYRCFGNVALKSNLPASKDARSSFIAQTAVISSAERLKVLNVLSEMKTRPEINVLSEINPICKVPARKVISNLGVEVQGIYISS